MKKILPLLLSLFPFFVFAQRSDSLALTREIDSLVQLNRNHIKEKSYEKALMAIEQAFNKSEKAFGKNSPSYAICAHNYGRTYFNMGQYPEAEAFYLKADSVWQVLGRENGDCAQNLYNLGYLYYLVELYEEAEPYYRESMNIRERIFGQISEHYAASIHGVAILYHDMGRVDQAEVYYIRTLEIWSKVFAEEGPLFADCLNNLSILYEELARYEEAEPLQLKALAIREKYLEEDPAYYAQSLDNLGALYRGMGRYREAEKLHLHAKELLEKDPDLKKDSGYPNCLLNLANVYIMMGRYEEAEPLLIESMAIYKDQYGPESRYYALSLNNLGVFYWTLKRYSEAEPLWIESLRIKKKFGEGTLDYCETLNNLGNLYWAMKQYEKAEPFYLEALNIRDTLLGKEHPDYAQSLNNLGMLYQHMGRFEKVASMYLAAKATMEKKLGKRHQNYTDIADNLAIFKCLTRQFEDARELFLEINQIRRDMILQSSHYLPEMDLAAYIGLFAVNLDEFYSFSQNHFGKMEDLPAVAYDNALFHKGFLLETINSRRNLVRSDLEAVRLDQDLKVYSRQLSREYAKPIESRNLEQLSDLEKKAKGIEKQLVQTLEGYGELIRPYSWREVQEKLRTGSAAIEFIHYSYHNPEPTTDSVMYAALVLLPNGLAPRFVPLFEEKQLLRLLIRPGLPEEVVVKDLYGNRSDLYRLLGKPLEPHLQGVNTVLYSPSGLLHFIDPEALLDETGASFLEGCRWDRFFSTRELVSGKTAELSYLKVGKESLQAPDNQLTAVLFGGIAFDMDSLAYVQANSHHSAAHPEDLQNPGFTNVQRGGSTDRWEYLPGTEREVEEIGALLRRAGFLTEIRKGYFASEELFKTIGTDSLSPHILLLATHGFFYPDPDKTASGSTHDVPIFKIQDDPMLRSGLLMAGANFYWKNKRPLSGHEDGVLVAYEVKDLNLRQTELVVLSACQTGLGDIAGSEGVYGLQRAFRIAGARFLIVSLWNVPDQATGELMLLFFRHWIEEGESMRDAFYHARQALRAKYENPYYWAGFILVD